MKYLKIFEKYTTKSYIEKSQKSNAEKHKYPIIIYKNDEFRIDCRKDGFKGYGDNMTGKYAISSIIDLVGKNSKYLDDPEFRNIEIVKKDREMNLDLLKLYPEKIENLRKNYTSQINGFLSNEDKNEIKKIPDNVYIKLTLKYYPILEKVIEESNIYGEIIDKYKIIYKELMDELKKDLAFNKYNIMR